MIGRDEYLRDLFLWGQSFHLFKQQTCITVPPMLGEGIDKAHPGREFGALDIIPSGIGAIRDQLIAVDEQQHPGTITDGFKKPSFAQQFIQENTCIPITSLDFVEPVVLSVAVMKTDDFHITNCPYYGFQLQR